MWDPDQITQRGHAQTSNPWKLRDNKCMLFYAAKWWSPIIEPGLLLKYLNYYNDHLILIILLCSCSSWGYCQLTSDPNSAILSWPYSNPITLHPVTLLFFILYEILPSQTCDRGWAYWWQWGWKNMWICPLSSLENQTLSSPSPSFLQPLLLPFVSSAWGKVTSSAVTNL